MVVLFIIIALIVVFLGTITIRALRYKPLVQESIPHDELDVDEALVTDHLAQMVQIKTVSNRNKELVDQSQFENFRELLKTLYPKVTKHCPRERIGETGILYYWKGKSNDEPTVLMAHYDVVPVEESGWEKPPFSGILDDNKVLWGRGTLDTKGTLCGIMEASEKLITQGFIPENDIYLSFSGDEEIMGPSAPAIVETLEKRGVKPGLVLDEGGAIVDNIFPGVKEKCAVVGIAEKGQMDVEFSIKSQGGHSSAPPVKKPVESLARGIAKVDKHPFEARLTPGSIAMFDVLGRYSTFGIKLIFANLWCFLPVLNLMCKKTGGELNALMRTTTTFTMMEGSKSANIIPPTANVTANLRLLPGDTMVSSINYMTNLINDDEIKIRKIQGSDPSPSANVKSPQWNLVKMAIQENWSNVIVSPYLMVACSDSRHFCKICDNVLRFSAMELSKEERGLIHAHNERIPSEKIAQAVKFFTRVIKKC